MKNSIYLFWLLAALILAGCANEEALTIEENDATVTVRGAERPFKGKLAFSTVTRTLGSPTVEVFAGGGNLTHLGRVSVLITQYIPGPGSFFGTIEITAANGDELVLDYTGQLTGVDLETLEFTSETDMTIADGSGRFLDAEGIAKGYGAGVFPDFPPGPEGDITVDVRVEGWIRY